MIIFSRDNILNNIVLQIYRKVSDNYIIWNDTKNVSLYYLENHYKYKISDFKDILLFFIKLNLVIDYNKYIIPNLETHYMKHTLVIKNINEYYSAGVFKCFLNSNLTKISIKIK